MRKTYRTFDSFRASLKGHHNFAVMAMMPHTYIIESESGLFDSEDFKRLKKHEQSYLRGMSDANFSAMYMHLQWAHIYDGKYCANLPYGDGFKQELVTESFHHYKGHPDRRF